ncbi:transferase family-domain-containing protein [Daldinia loculata]|uniref:transferase family-domain-containing protein n=1 Tax=Daldinia loculata TaxID=103429 RepID=UPI0020C53646|nr:transferase family-domain-containing protein [Daldinia loculata]KAI1645172.1 transferase family-domain-containing protein [Daldinia loculata]
MQSGPILPQSALGLGDAHAISDTSSRFQDVIGQFPQLKTYSHALAIFPLNPGVSQDSVVAALKDAISQIISKIPWLGEQVVHEGQGLGNSGIIRTRPLPSGISGGDILYVRDCTNLCPSYEDIIQRGGPLSSLDGNILCPFPGFPMGYDVEKMGFAPVVAVQASFIKGGVILNISNQHNMVDTSGVFVFNSLLAIAMQGKDIPQAYVDQANIDRTKVIPLLDPGQPIRDHSYLLKSAFTPTPAPPLKLPASPLKWACFRVFQKAMPKIKAAASIKDEFDSSVTYISSNDALCALYWKRLAAVRVANGSVAPSSVSKFARAIDVRAAVGCPPGYMGQMIHHAITRFSYRDLASPELTLSTIASRLRAELNQSANEWAVRSYATFVAGVADKGELVYGGGLNPALDVGSSSVSQLVTGLVDFGVLGKPTLMRRPNLAPFGGVMYVLPPEDESQYLPVIVCLSERDLEGLRQDKEWGAATQYVG